MKRLSYIVKTHHKPILLTWVYKKYFISSIGNSEKKKISNFDLIFSQDHQGKPSNASKDPSSDYQEGATHVFSVIHDILAQHRALEAKWHAKKIKLHQRLALRLFQEDVKQVNF